MRSIRLLFLGMAIAALLLSAELFHEGKDTESWPTIRGQMNAAAIMKFGGGTSHSTLTTSNIDLVRYSYTVDGKKYSGDRVTLFDMPFGNGMLAHDYLAEIDLVTPLVRYRPDDPAKSVLIAGPPYRVIFSLLSVCVAAFGIFFGWNRIIRFFVNYLDEGLLEV